MDVAPFELQNRGRNHSVPAELTRDAYQRVEDHKDSRRCCEDATEMLPGRCFHRSTNRGGHVEI